MPKSRMSTIRRAGVVFGLTTLLAAVFASPAHAHKWESQKPGNIHCDAFDMKKYTADGSIENPKVTMYDDKGNLLAVQVKLAVVVNAKLIVCVEVDAAADVNIVLDGVLDKDGNGKKDTIVVRVDVVAKANVKVNVKVTAKIKGQIGLTIGVALNVKANIVVDVGEKKSMKCYAKDSVDTY